MRLTKNFTLREFTQSQYATRYDIDNEPNDEQTEALRALCEKVLQPLRDHYGKSVRISSGFRCQELNKAIGGASSSQHTKGQAADIEIPGIDNLEVAKWIADNLEYDQLISEYYIEGDKNSGWIHVSWRESPRMQTLTKKSKVKGYIKGLPE